MVIPVQKIILNLLKRVDLFLIPGLNLNLKIKYKWECILNTLFSHCSVGVIPEFRFFCCNQWSSLIQDGNAAIVNAFWIFYQLLNLRTRKNLCWREGTWTHGTLPCVGSRNQARKWSDLTAHVARSCQVRDPYRVQVVGAVLFPVRLLGRPLRLRLQEPLLQHQGLLNILLANSVERLIEPRYAITLTSPVTLDSTSKSINNSLPLWWQHVSHSYKTTSTSSSHSCYHSRSQEALAWGGGSGDGLARNESTIHAAAPSPAPGIHDACFTDAHAEWVCQFEVYDKKGSIGNSTHAHGGFTRRPHRYRTHTPTQIHMFHVRVLNTPLLATINVQHCTNYLHNTTGCCCTAYAKRTCVPSCRTTGFV